MKIAIFLIATNKYVDFIPELVKGINKYFLTDHEKTIYLFTDSDKKISGVTKIYQEHKPWPYPTLYRYHIITNGCKGEFDYYYYLDSDSLIVDTVGDEILGKLVATRHPGFFNRPKLGFILDKKFLAQSFVSINKIQYYFAGGFNGGSDYLKMATQITRWIDIDQKYGHTPIFHDESYIQRYYSLNPPDVILTPEYCMPETMPERENYGLTNMKPNIIAITKKNVVR
jgi:Glycosyltransferase family 6.